MHLAVVAALFVVPPAAGDRSPDPGTFEVVFEEPAPSIPRLEEAPAIEVEPVAPAEVAPVHEQTVAEAAPAVEQVPVPETAEVAEIRQPLPLPPKPERAQAKAPEAAVPAAPAPPPASSRPAESGSSAAAAPGRMVSYIARLQAWLERHKSYPRQARSDRIEGVVVLYFAVGRKGDLLAYRIEKSSGHALLDDATIDLIRRAHPMPPMPDDLGQERLEVVVPILYALRR